ncbi:asparagine synthase-related protein [Cognatiluteimonas profundi]|uniref:asparagine synthase-related protein n=1 Tax=Cognatiluteimonas profundi TaxID=2594501 RepID=UPI00131CD349|nr:asparagine synthase-related protein [Lysobacter profundi]
MQGICGFFHLDQQPASPATLARMRDALVRTAWSSGETLADGPVAFAGVHWATGERVHVPALLTHDPASGCHVVADARLDDRIDLAGALGLSPGDARQASDASLILQAWLRWGTDCVDRLEGDFAFAIHDPRRGGLFLARDRMGVRPLHVHLAPGQLCVFASSTSAVLAHPQVPATLDEGRIADFLVTQLEGIDKSSTFHRDIRRLPPAHWLAITRDEVREQRYWSLQRMPAGQLPTTDAGWTDALTDALEAAVARHLAGPERVGCMLSGGLDSSSLAIIANRQLAASGREALATFSSIDGSDMDCAETRAIRAMLDVPGFQPTLVDHARLTALRPRLLRCIDDAEEPFDVATALLHAQYLAASGQGIDAVMDGLDGDSLFLAGGGLSRQLRSGHWLAAWHNACGLQRIHGKASAPTWRVLGTAARSALLPKALRPALRAMRRGPDTRRNIAMSLIAPEFARRTDLRGRLATLAAQRSPGPGADAPAEALQALDHAYLTVALERYHRVAAAHGIQPRHPLTDRRLVELCVNLPDAQRFANGWSKAVLRRSMQSRLPAAVCWRTGKQHLGWSLNRKLREGDHAALGDRLGAVRGLLQPYVDLSRLDAALARLRGTGDDLAAELVFDALSLGNWLDRNAHRAQATAVRSEREPVV